MRVGILFSGGKDSTFALMKLMDVEHVACLITITSKNDESYMFHTPNVELTKLQAEAMDLPLVERTTDGVKEDELADLEAAMVEAKEKFGIEGVVTGAVESVYQSSRIKKICDKLGLKCLNPLWKRDQRELLEEMVGSGIKAIIVGVFAPPLDEKWLGREIDGETVDELVDLQQKFKISPTGEGGEIETAVLDAPFFRKRIEVVSSESQCSADSCVLVIKKARLADKV